MEKRAVRFPALVAAVVLVASGARAAPIMHVHDSSGVLATIDVVTGDAHVIGSMGVQMTDIAFDPTGALFGLSFNGFYAIDPSTAAVTFIGSHPVPFGNALVFGTDGTLYAAGATSTLLFTIDPLTGAGMALGDMGFESGGDLAFYDGGFYLASNTSQLVLVDLADLANTAAVGPFGVSSVFGLATGDDGMLYGVAGTQIFSVDASTGAATSPVDYAGQGLGNAFGQGFFTESGAPPVPEPGPLALLAAGGSALLVTRGWRKAR